jgi:hypothetical protein
VLKLKSKKKIEHHPPERLSRAGINQLVYKLYNLTNEEIKIVEKTDK